MLHAACSGGSVFIVNYLLNHKVAGLESRGEDGETPVMVAAKNGQKQVFDILVKKRCNLSVVDDLGDTVLHAACCSDSVDMVTNLLSKKMVDIESRGEDGLTPVMCAAMEGQTEVFNALVSQGCDLSVVDDEGENILHAACYSNNVTIVKDILSRKLVDINSKGDDGDTPLMVAAREGNRKVFDLLLSKDCDLLEVSDGGNILHAACLSNDAVLVKDILLRGIADIESKNNNGATPVILAAEAGQRKYLIYLWDNNNMLHAASYGGSVQIVESILSRKVADMESRGENGATPVMLAAKSGQRKVFDLLVRNDCNLSEKDDSDRNILHYACVSDNVQIVEYIISQGLDDLNSKDENGQTPMMVAEKEATSQPASQPTSHWSSPEVFGLILTRYCPVTAAGL
ncbi:putative ankyrin repeat protein RF_0381 [Haliotis rubra]|uniref:putative ankyrin repeat protein RF_0381 n=1 Tax=Haliotis rubra TaxID=36100 RepID=UPI001EE55840|nr:putative ankyrin repeat protein RF_0381 [Haliotis rubra]